MKTCRLTYVGLFAAIISVSGENGFESISDGRSLTGWQTPDPSYWTVENGAITGRITKEHPCTVNQYLVWKGGELADFELKLSSRLNGEGSINNGFQFRSRLLPDHDICGYQVDNNLQTPWLVRLYDEFGRHTLAMRGERTLFDATTGAPTTSEIEDSSGTAWFRLEDWHEYHLTCVGTKITLRVNGRLAAEIEDNDRRRQELQGILALQLHSGPPTVVQFKDIQLKVLKPAEKLRDLKPSEMNKRRTALLRQTLAYWLLDVGGHGAKPPLRHIPGWSQFELNVKADDQGARSGAKVALLNGAYFDAGPTLNVDGTEVTIFLRARDPRGKWDAALFGKGGGRDNISFSLFSADLPQTPGADIGFKVRTDQGFAMVSFPVSEITPSAWHDLVGRYDGNTLTLFCDGKLRASKPHQGIPAKNNEPLLIGAEPGVREVARHFHGELEEAALWSQALSDEEIRALSYQP